MAGFDKRKFGAAKFAPRTKELDFSKSVLADFFPEDEKAIFVVRGLTAVELAIANEAVTKNKTVGTVLEALLAEGDHEEKVNELREVMGLSKDKVPDATVKSREMLILGSVKPALDLHDVKKISDVAPIEFQILVNEITKLTGQGQEAKVKRKPSGQGTTSKQA